MTPPTLQQTRRQLDDLDGLIQRMLAMPTTHLDEREAQMVPEALRLPPEEFAPLPFPNRLLAGGRIAATDTPEQQDSPVRSWRVEFGPARRESTIPLPGETGEEADLPFASAVVEDVPRPPLPEVPPMAEPVVELPLALRPFALLNRAFDSLVGWGPLSFVTRPAGKSLVGWLGIAMIAASACWAYLDWAEFRWTEPGASPKMK